MCTLRVVFFFICYFVATLALHSRGGLFGIVFRFQKLCLCRCGVINNQMSMSTRSGRLLGGELVNPHQFPWLALVNVGSQVIGGSLISDRHIITAASPLYGIPESDITVSLGAHDLCGVGNNPALNVSVISVSLHPNFSPTNLNNNLALIRLGHDVPFSETISPICLPFIGHQETEQVAWTAAWRLNHSNLTCTPRAATLPVLSTKSCLQGDIDLSLWTPDKGCLGPLGAKSVICKADVGAPVMWRWSSGTAFRLVGVISSASCDHTISPLYTKIFDHTAWIHDHIRTDCQCF